MQKRVSEFVILAPEGAHNALVYSRERLRSYLAARFPGFHFSLAPLTAAAADDEFVVVPVVGEVGGTAKESRLLEVIDEVLDDIRTALEQFEISSSLLH